MITPKQSRDLFLLNKLRNEPDFAYVRSIVADVCEHRMPDGDDGQRQAAWEALLELMGDAQR